MGQRPRCEKHVSASVLRKAPVHSTNIAQLFNNSVPLLLSAPPLGPSLCLALGASPVLHNSVRFCP